MLMKNKDDMSENNFPDFVLLCSIKEHKRTIIFIHNYTDEYRGERRWQPSGLTMVF